MTFTRRTFLKTGAAGATVLATPSILRAQSKTTLKFAHVYEVNEPYHTWAVWAGQEFEKRTNGKYAIQVFPASALGKESDINEGLGLGTVDMIYTGQLFRRPLTSSMYTFSAPIVERPASLRLTLRTGYLVIRLPCELRPLMASSLKS